MEDYVDWIGFWMPTKDKWVRGLWFINKYGKWESKYQDLGFYWYEAMK